MSEDRLKDDERAASLRRELRAMEKIATLMDELQAGEQASVVTWLADRYKEKSQ